MTKPNSMTSEQYKELVRMLKAEGWTIVCFGELNRNEVLIINPDGATERCLYEPRGEIITNPANAH